MNPIYIGAAAVAVLITCWWIWSRRKPSYESREYLLTQAEHRFFQVLLQAVPEGLHICPQVRMADLIDCYRDSRRSSFAAIAHKHIDFVLMEVETAEIVLAIEVDDATHQRPDRMERDRFIEDALNTAGVPLLRVPVAAHYDVRRIRSEIESCL